MFISGACQYEHRDADTNLEYSSSLTEVQDGKGNGVKTERKDVFDILKALGIISIVIGHCHFNRAYVDFVYSYHLALFLFVSGLQYNIKKYSRAPFVFLQSRVKSMWPPFFCYLTFFTLTHDLALRLHLLPDGIIYGKRNMLFRVLNNFVFMGGEMLGGALWFVPVMLITMMWFATIAYFAYTFFYKIRLILVVVFSCFVGVLGVYCNLNFIQLDMNLHTGLLLLPVFTAGYVFKYFSVDFNKVIRWYIAVPCFIYVYWEVIKNGHRIELSAELIGGSCFYFYTITFSGLYFVCYLAKIIERCAFLSRIFVCCGRYTFDIMALHFLVFKVIDVCYGRWIGDMPANYSVFPCAYRGLWPIYVVVSISLSPWVRISVSKLFAWLKFNSQYHKKG